MLRPPRLSFLLLILTIAALLAACGANPFVTATPSASPQPPSQTPTPSLAPSATRTPLPTYTPTRVLSPTPTATPGIFSAVPIPPIADHLRVIQPDKQMLWDVVRMAGRVGERDGEDWNLEQVTSSEQAALYRLVEHDLRALGPLEPALAMQLIEDGEFKADGSQPFIAGLVRENLLIKLNQSDITFKHMRSSSLADFDLKPYLLEMDGDEQPEWLVNVANERLAFYEWLFLDQPAPASYTLLPADPLTMPFGSSHAQVRLTHDFSGDGRNEVVFLLADYAWGSNFAFLQVFSYQGGRVVQRLALERYVRSTDFWGVFEDKEIDIELSDVNYDGQDEIRVTLPRSANFGCTWTETDIYRWDGDQPRFELKGEQPPETPTCLAARALDLNSGLAPDQKSLLLEKAITGLAGSGSPELMAVLRLQLAATYAIQGQDEKAQQTLDALARQSGSQPLVAQIKEKYQDANGSLLKMCDKLYRWAQYGQIPEESEVLSYLSFSASLGSYPNTPQLYPPMLCPLPDLARAQLERMEIPAGEDPLIAIAAAGFPVGPSAEVQLDQDEAQEMAALIELGEPQVIVLDADAQTWRISRAARLSGRIESVQFKAHDLFEDGQTELVVAALLKKPLPFSAFTACWGPEDGHTTQFFAIHSTGRHYDAYWGDELCGDSEPDLAEFAENYRLEFGLLQGWPLQPGQALSEILRRRVAFSEQEIHSLEEDTQIWRGMNGLLDEVLVEGQDEAIPTSFKLEIMVSWLSPQTPGGDRLVQRMLYLSALEYELNQQADQAGEIYTGLISYFPDSIWAWLAWARLSPASITGF